MGDQLISNVTKSELNSVSSEECPWILKWQTITVESVKEFQEYLSLIVVCTENQEFLL